MKLVFPALIVTTILFWGCTHKDGIKPLTAATYDFSYSGSRLLGDSMRFASTAPAASTFLWRFGDGSISSLPTPSHVYSVIPSYYDTNNHTHNIASDTILLVVNNDTLHPITKYLRLNPDIQTFTGMHNWSDYTVFGSWSSLKTTYYPDTTFGISLNDSTSINFGGIILYYFPDSNFSFGSTLAFVSKDPTAPTISEPLYELSYNRLTDSIFIYISYDPTALGGESLQYFSSP